jgi:hypothetical protein
VRPAPGDRGPRPSRPRAALDELRLGATTPAEVEARFGAPDERGAEGALTYRYAKVRRVDRRLVGLSLPSSEELEEHAVTFRFANGALSKICETRS